MSVEQAKNNVVYSVIQANDPEAAEVTLAWFKEQHPDVSAEEVDLTIPAEQRVWFVKHPRGNVMMVPAADFISDFDLVDPMAEFLRQLEEAPTAEEPGEADEKISRAEAQRISDAFIGERVKRMLNEFEDLLGMAQDEDDSTAQEGVEWAYARFKQVFGITE